MSAADPGAWRERPERVVLPVRPGAQASPRPPVRIFLGTEPSQYRATRAFIWSIEQVRDPERVYEIHVMSELAGFDRRGWTTGFTNYRFAIPHFCEGRGRAIYNDEDQIYLADPALLFDRDLGESAYLAISDSESSVMLLDCERMAKIWSLDDAKRRGKKSLLARARAEDGVRGHLDFEWNARDAEYRAGRSKLLHYTTLHTQPWRPFPERFVYQDSPHAQLWHAIEQSAIQAGFEPFHREAPSRRFAADLERARARDDIAETPPPEPGDAALVALESLLARAGARSLLAIVPGRGGQQDWPLAGLSRARRVGLASLLAVAEPLEIHDAVACCGGLEDVPPDDAAWVVEELFRRARSAVFACVACPDPPRARRGMPPAGTLHTPGWWAAHFETAARRHPQVHWELATRVSGESGLRFRAGGRALGDAPPRVWLLADDRPGNTTQSTGLAEELGWPFERIDLAFNALTYVPNPAMGASVRAVRSEHAARLKPPWPDLVIAAGRRTAPVARWIGEQSRGRTKLVQLGRKGANPAEPFDLAVTPGYARLLPHPSRLETALPISRVRDDLLEEAGRRWQSLFAGSPHPRIALLVGGHSQRHAFGAAEAAELGRRTAALVAASGGSLFVTTSRRTSPAAVEALRRELPTPVHFHCWSADERREDNPFLGLLALADALVVTGESESMLSEACATGKAVYIHPMPDRRRGPILWLADHVIDAVVARAYAKPLNNRGTARPQQGLERLCARLVASGWIRPNRDLDRMHATLVERKAARMLADGYAGLDAGGASELERVAERVRSLMGR